MLEVFGSPTQLGARWPHLVRALAVEAAVLEVQLELIGEELSDTEDPNRYLADVRRLTLELHGEGRARKAGGGSRIHETRTSQGMLRGLVVDDDLVHAVLLTDPRLRREGGDDGFDPNLLSGRRPRSEYERRLRERRSGFGGGGRRVPPTAPPQPPRAPPVRPPEPPLPPPDGG